MMRWNQQWRVPVAQWQSFAYPFQHVCRASGSICSVPWGAWEIRGVLLRQMPLRVVWWEAVGTCGNTGSCEYTGREKLPWGWSNCREAVGFPSLGVLKAWPSSPNLLSCALRTAWDWTPLPASVMVSVCSVCSRVAFHSFCCKEVPWGAGHVTVTFCSQLFGITGHTRLPSSQMTGSWQERHLQLSLGTS